MKKISLCLTNYNRREMLIESFSEVHDDPRISRVIIADDYSSWDNFVWVNDAVKKFGNVIVSRNKVNLGMSRNKMQSVMQAPTKWGILFDSDNKLNVEYLDALYNLDKWEEDTIYMPDFAQPQFDYKIYGGHTIDKHNVLRYLDLPMFDCLLNTCNYFVNRKRYVETYEFNPEMKASDTVYFNYLWLKNGGKFHIVPNMRYFHRVHDGSGFLEDTDYNLQKAKEVREMIRQVGIEASAGNPIVTK